MDIKWEKNVGKTVGETQGARTLVAKGPDGNTLPFTRVGADGTSLIYVSETGKGKGKKTLYLYVKSESQW